MIWRVDATETLAEGIFARFERLHVTTSGGPAIRDVVRHPGGVAVLPVRDGRVTLIRQYRVAVDRHLLEAPAGKLEPGEDPMPAARRECEEEVGIRPGEMTSLGHIETSPGFTDEVIHLFVAFDGEPVASAPEGAEEVEAEVVTLELADAVGAIGTGEITDAKTCVLLLAVAAGLVDRGG